MKKVLLVAITLLSTMLLTAQGVYQIWGVTRDGSPDNMGVIFNTGVTGNNFQLKHAECPGPVIVCSEDTIVYAKAGHCGAIVAYDPIVTIDLCGNTTVIQTTGLPSKSFFPVGTTINTFVASSTSGKNDTCSFTVTVKDKEPPQLTRLEVQ